VSGWVSETLSKIQSRTTKNLMNAVMYTDHFWDRLSAIQEPALAKRLKPAKCLV
jgi:hypothetical protein